MENKMTGREVSGTQHFYCRNCSSQRQVGHLNPHSKGAPLLTSTPQPVP